MAESEEQVDLPEHVDEEDEGGYQPPAPKSLDEIMKTDAEDESLVKYKQQLLGGGTEEKIFCKLMIRILGQMFSRRHSEIFFFIF